MRLQELFRPDDLLIGFRPLDKWDAIDRLMEHLTQGGRVPAAVAPQIHEAVLARERSMSTGMERGVAIPHAAVDGLDEAVAALAVVPADHELTFESVDASPTRIVVLLLIPRAQKLLHIRTLADVARVLGREEVRRALFASESAEAAWHALGESDAG